MLDDHVMSAPDDHRLWPGREGDAFGGAAQMVIERVGVVHAGAHDIVRSHPAIAHQARVGADDHGVFGSRRLRPDILRLARLARHKGILAHLRASENDLPDLARPLVVAEGVGGGCPRRPAEEKLGHLAHLGVTRLRRASKPRR